MLYVFVHGLTVVRDRPDGNIEIVLPRIRGHVYKAGAWLAETAIEDGATLTLTNVTGGTADVRKTGFLIDIPDAYPVTQRGRAGTVVAPKPVEILGLARAVDTRHVAIVQASVLAPAASFDTLADVLVLVYDFADETKVFLDGHYWEPYTTGGAMNLHLIATSEVVEGEEHLVETENTLREVFRDYPGIAYTKTAPRPEPASWRDAANPAFFGSVNARVSRGRYILEANGSLAFAKAELEHPASRAQRLERLGRMHRHQSRIEGLWDRPDPLNAGCACGSISGN